MRKINLIKTSFFLLFSVFCFCTQAQEKHTIELTCSTSQLNDDNINQVCNFGQNDNEPNENFTIEADVDDLVLWESKYKIADIGYIDIVKIDYESGVNIFKDKHIYDDEDRSPDGKIYAVVKKGNDGEMLKYKITFDAYDKGGDFVGRFSIDPKIRIRSRR